MLDGAQNSFQKNKQNLLKGAARKHKHALRRLDACRHELSLCRQWESLFHEGMLLQANLFRVKRGMGSISVSDWLADGQERPIALDPLVPPHEQVKKMFRLSKKRRAAIPHLEKQVKVRELLCEGLQGELELLEHIEDADALEGWKRRNHHGVTVGAKGRPETKLPYHQFYSESGLPILVGKGAKSNDILTFRTAKGSDWWFHVRDYPGSHVVLSVVKGKDPDESAVYDAMLLALAYSKAREERQAEITVTQCKHVHRFGGGIAGKVQLGKHKVMSVVQDPDRLKRIRAQSK